VFLTIENTSNEHQLLSCRKKIIPGFGNSRTPAAGVQRTTQ